jgi:hypothetical protein
MRIKYTLADQPQEFEISDSDELSDLCTETEMRLRADHPELAERSHLTERIADALLNSLAGDADDAELGDLS